jgi:predicted enzyme related to lactoylglutathione lyase
MATPRGKFVWYDVMTTDTKAAAKFYSEVVGWSAQEHPMQGGGSYTVFSNGPVMVGGLMAIPEDARAQGVPPCWSGYVSTDDVDAEAKRVGRFAVAADPGGAAFLLFKPNTTEEPKPVAMMTPGHIAWHELMAGDLDREFNFYAGLFGWTKDKAHDMGPMGVYQIFAIGGQPLGGMMKVGAQMPHPAWNYYIAVDSVAAAADRAFTRGAKVLNGPMEVPGGAWIVQARDPQGAHFALISAGK